MRDKRLAAYHFHSFLDVNHCLGIDLGIAIFSVDLMIDQR